MLHQQENRVVMKIGMDHTCPKKKKKKTRQVFHSHLTTIRKRASRSHRRRPQAQRSSRPGTEKFSLPQRTKQNPEPSPHQKFNKWVSELPEEPGTNKQANRINGDQHWGKREPDVSISDVHKEVSQKASNIGNGGRREGNKCISIIHSKKDVITEDIVQTAIVGKGGKKRGTGKGKRVPTVLTQGWA